MKYETDSVISEWDNVRYKHPFFGENLSDEQIDRVWNDSADTYEDGVLEDIHDRISDYLLSEGYLNKDTTLLDIGCGPGTYSLRFSNHVKSITAIDKSPRMVNRIIRESESRGVKNLSAECVDWNQYVPDKTYDVAFSSLCPPVNSHESILRMEKCSGNTCVYISSMSGNRDSVYFEIWKRLGRNYTFEGYDTRYPCRFLKSIGRNPALKIFENKMEKENCCLELCEHYKQKFSHYGHSEDISELIEDVVYSFAEDGQVYTVQNNRLGLLIWDVL